MFSYKNPRNRPEMTIPNGDTGPYSVAIAPTGPSGTNYHDGHPLSTDPTARRYLSKYNDRPGRQLSDNMVTPQGPGLDGPYRGLGMQPREAIATALSTQVSYQGASMVGGNQHAFLPPPDKFMVLKAAMINRLGGKGTQASNNPPSLAGTRAPVGNG
jgi:hypothetical protein